MSSANDKALVAVIGGGAAGYFAAAACAAAAPEARVVILEGTQRPLTKVRISGGGRCNVTHDCFEPSALVGSYPRGHRELRGPFSRFQPKDTLAWFAARGVAIKAEADGRMFPTTDNSQTIIDCLQKAARDAGVETKLGAIVKAMTPKDGGFELTLRDGTLHASRVILCTGSAPSGHAFAKALGHQIVEPMPSLFTFNVKDPRIEGLAGVSFPTVALKLADQFKQNGPLLFTHWGLSGPAVLKLSAWAARELCVSNYRAELEICFTPGRTATAVQEEIWRHKLAHPRKQSSGDPAIDVPKRFWQRLVEIVVGPEPQPWADLSKDAASRLATELAAGRYAVDGKGVFKEEFVTAGGVNLKEVDFRTMESRVAPGLYFAGEVLDIDGITGGFNFQNAWTTGWIAGHAAAASLQSATN